MSNFSLNRIFDKTQVKPVATVSENFTVSGAGARYGNYVFRLKYVPDFTESITITGGTASGGATWTRVTTAPTAAGQFYISPITGTMEFYSADVGFTGTLEYVPHFSLVQAEDINQLIVWSMIKPAFIPGIPPVETISGGGWASPPLATIRIPSGYADQITIKSVDLTCSDTSALVDVPNDAMTLVLTTCDSYNQDATSWVQKPGVSNVDGVTASLSSVDADLDVRYPEWWRSTTAVDWPIDLTSGDVYINIFREPAGLAKHASITVDIRGI